MTRPIVRRYFKRTWFTLRREALFRWPHPLARPAVKYLPWLEVER